MTPEGKIKAQIKRMLGKYPRVYYHMPVQNGMGEPTLDFVGCCNGYFFAVEAKAPGKKPTARQLLTMDNMRAAGAFVFLVSCESELNQLEAYLCLLGA